MKDLHTILEASVEEPTQGMGATGRGKFIQRRLLSPQEHRRPHVDTENLQALYVVVAKYSVQEVRWELRAPLLGDMQGGICNAWFPVTPAVPAHVHQVGGCVSGAGF